MSTSDGISTADWNIVHELAVDLVNASDDQMDVRRTALLDWLATLQRKYGPCPSILATRADYIDEDDPERETLFLQAHSLAESAADHANMLYVAHSLAELYLGRRDLANLDRWLTRMRGCLADITDSGLTADYHRLRAEYRRLMIRPVSLVAD